MSVFSDICDFIRNKEVGELFYRWQLMHIYKGTTTDQYRRRLQICGYIDTVDQGIYVVLKKIPAGFTTSKLEKEYIIQKNINPEFAYKNNRMKLSIRDMFMTPKSWLNFNKTLKNYER